MSASTTSESTAVAIVQGGYDLSPRNFDEAWRLAEIMADSGMVPKDYEGKPGKCLIAVQWGAEIGLKPMQAVQNIAVINNRPSLWGDAMLALVRASPLCRYVIESDDGTTATCRTWRHGEPQEQVRTFSAEEAKVAGLAGKGPWQQYAKRMRQMRARAFLLRDVYTDVLKGLHMAEEAMDMPEQEKFMGQADVVEPPAPTPAPPPEGYPQEKFDANFAQWEGIVQSKRKTHAAMVAFIEAKGVKLTELQKARINSIKVPAAETPTAKEPDEFVAPTFAAVVDQIMKAKNRDECAAAGDLIKHIEDETLRPEAQAKFDARWNELAA